MTPRRSVLYMPGANTRAMEKAREIDCDGIVFDLEDAVAPEDLALRIVDAWASAMKSVTLRVPCFTPAQAHLSPCALIGTACPPTAHARARSTGRGVAEVDGRLVEHIHATEAERTLAFARALAARDG